MKLCTGSLNSQHPAAARSQLANNHAATPITALIGTGTAFRHTHQIADNAASTRNLEQNMETLKQTVHAYSNNLDGERWDACGGAKEDLQLARAVLHVLENVIVTLNGGMKAVSESHCCVMHVSHDIFIWYGMVVSTAAPTMVW